MLARFLELYIVHTPFESLRFGCKVDVGVRGTKGAKIVVSDMIVIDPNPSLSMKNDFKRTFTFQTV